MTIPAPACEATACWRVVEGLLIGVLLVANGAIVFYVYLNKRALEKLVTATNEGLETVSSSGGPVPQFLGHKRAWTERVEGAANMAREGTKRFTAKVMPESGPRQIQRNLTHAMGRSRSPRLKSKAPNDWEINPREVKIGRKLAQGSFGVVYKGEWCGMTVAVKEPIKDIAKEMLDKFVIEVDLMTKLHHPNIVVCLGASLQPGNMLLLLEYLERGCLYDFLGSKDAETMLTYSKVVKFNIDIARGMRYLHNRANVIQRDLKSRNLLLDDSYNVKICDFGLSRLNQRQDDNTMTACGTPYWAAPEVIMGEAYNTKADVFSYAIVMWELITRDEPYDGRPGLDIAYAVAQDGLRPKIPKYCPDRYRDLMEQCWSLEPRKRPDFSEILERLHEIARGIKAKAMAEAAASQHGSRADELP